MKRMKLVLAAILLLAVAGCATNGQHSVAQIGSVDALVQPDARVDRIVVKSSELEGSVYEVDVVQVRILNPDGSVAINPETGLPAIVRMVREGRNAPFGGQLLLNTVPGVATAATQGAYGKSIARTGRCPEGAICNSNVILNEGSEAVSISESAAGATSNANITGTLGGCAEANCGGAF